MNDANEGASLARAQEPLPAIVVDPQQPGGLEAAVRHALGEAGLRQQIVAIFLVPLGAQPPSRSALASLRHPGETEDIVIDSVAYEVFLRGRAVPLTRKEFGLLHYLYEHRGAVITREKLLHDVWGEGYRGGLRTVDIHIRRLRGKLGAQCVETTRGVGYKFPRRR